MLRSIKYTEDASALSKMPEAPNTFYYARLRIYINRSMKKFSTTYCS